MPSGVFWFGLAILTGVGLRFVELPDWAIPSLVGVGVATLAVLAMRYLLPQEEETPPTAVAPSTTNGRSSASHRLSAMKRRPPSLRSRNQVSEN